MTFGKMITTSHWIVAAVILCCAFAAWVVFAFNRLVREKNLMREAWSGIDVQLRRRHNLIPNLVEIVKGYGSHERNLLSDITRLRARSIEINPESIKALETSENALSQLLKSLLVLVEAYPNLKADTNFMALQRQLVEVEDQLQYARRYYNGTVRNYNIRVESFPGNLVAGVFGFGLAEFFQIETATERAAPEVEL